MLENPRHVGSPGTRRWQANAIHLYDPRLLPAAPPTRKCWNEAPAPGPSTPEARARGAWKPAARPAWKSTTGGAGTFEFLYEDGDFFFIEMKPPASRVEAPGHRDGHGRRHRQGAAAYCLGHCRAEDSPGRRQESTATPLMPDQRRRFPAPFIAAPPSGKGVAFYHAPGGLGVRMDSHLYTGHTVAAPLRLADWQADHLGRRPRDCANPHAQCAG